MPQESTRDIVIETRTTMNALVKTVKNLVESVDGTDGQPGMRSDIRALKDDVKITQEKNEKKSSRSWQMLTLAIAETITILGLIASIVFK